MGAPLESVPGIPGEPRSLSEKLNVSVVVVELSLRWNASCDCGPRLLRTDGTVDASAEYPWEILLRSPVTSCSISSPAVPSPMASAPALRAPFRSRHRRPAPGGDAVQDHVDPVRSTAHVHEGGGRATVPRRVAAAHALQRLLLQLQALRLRSLCGGMTAVVVVAAFAL